jgi:tetratricopeptide (TPR) repeat protein
MPDQMKPSRLLKRLEAEIAGARSQLEADCKRAERAAYLARVGRFDEARAEVAVLQERNQRIPQIDLSIWTNFAEGLIAYFDNVGESTTDRVQRAYALSVAGGRNRMRALCAAWLAQWDYSKTDMSGLARHVREALSIADPDDHAIRSRTCLVAAQALHLAGRLDLATPWYGKSRFHASVDCDDVTISALMHNMAWLRMMSIRQTVLLTGRHDARAAAHALTTAESNESFDQLKGDSSWIDLKPILRAQIASLHGDPGQAVALYEQHLASAGAPARLQANLFADKAWCHTELGQRSDAIESAALALKGLGGETHVDDRAATHSRLAQAFAALGNAIEHDHHLELARRAWDQHIELQGEAIRLLEGMDDRGKNS